MLEIQKKLIHDNENLESIQEKFGIKSTKHEDGRVILNYDQIKSKPYKTEDFVRECRGLVLGPNWEIVSKPFTRFFNLGEVREFDNEFVWEEVVGFHKEDGSLLVISYYDGDWSITTRASFADGKIHDNNITWRELAINAIGERFFDIADTSFTYVFELCSLYNKVVRTYSYPQAYLLSVFEGQNELDWNHTQWIAKNLEQKTPEQLIFHNIDEAQSYLEKKAKEDKTFEGLVLRDRSDNRIKIKSPDYVALHRMVNNGNPASIKTLLPLVLEGEQDEWLQYYPEVEDSVKEIEQYVDNWAKDLDSLFSSYKEIDCQKEFALKVKHHPFSSILFKARKEDRNAVDVFYDSHDLILKRLKDTTH